MASIQRYYSKDRTRRPPIGAAAMLRLRLMP